MRLPEPLRAAAIVIAWLAQMVGLLFMTATIVVFFGDLKGLLYGSIGAATLFYGGWLVRRLLRRS